MVCEFSAAAEIPDLVRAGLATVLHLRAGTRFGGADAQVLRCCQLPTGTRAILAVVGGRGAAQDAAHGEDGSAADGPELVRAARAAGVETMALPGGGWPGRRSVAALERLVREQRVKLICTHDPRADVLGAWVARRRSLPVVHFLRGTAEGAVDRLYAVGGRALWGRASRLVCLSRTQEAALPARVARAQVRIVTNAIEPCLICDGEREAARAELMHRFGLPAPAGLWPPLVAMAGRLGPDRGALEFLRAAAAVRAHASGNGARAQFLIVGDGPLRESLVTETRRLGLGGAVHVAGAVADWPRLLPGVDVFVYPALRGHFPQAVLEAMSVAVPVVATRVGALAELAGVGETAAPVLDLVPAGNPQSMAERILMQLANPARRANLGLRGCHRVRTAYAPDRQWSQLQALYEELLPELAAGRKPPDRVAPEPTAASVSSPSSTH